jgi:hypothetical protein
MLWHSWREDAANKKLQENNWDMEHGGLVHHQNWESLKDSALKGCKLCLIIWTALWQRVHREARLRRLLRSSQDLQTIRLKVLRLDADRISANHGSTNVLEVHCRLLDSQGEYEARIMLSAQRGELQLYPLCIF